MKHFARDSKVQFSFLVAIFFLMWKNKVFSRLYTPFFDRLWWTNSYTILNLKLIICLVSNESFKNLYQNFIKIKIIQWCVLIEKEVCHVVLQLTSLHFGLSSNGIFWKVYPLLLWQLKFHFAFHMRSGKKIWPCTKM